MDLVEKYKKMDKPSLKLPSDKLSNKDASNLPMLNLLDI